MSIKDIWLIREWIMVIFILLRNKQNLGTSFFCTFFSAPMKIWANKKTNQQQQPKRVLEKKNIWTFD